MAQITLVTGPSGAGKTSWVTRQARAFPGPVAGVICPGAFEEGRKSRIDAHLLRTGEILPLAYAENLDSFATKTARWGFVEATIDAVNEELRRPDPADLLVIDELGPLEFNRNQGFTAAFDAINRHAGQALIVVRESLLTEAVTRWPGAKIQRINP